ncbi:hypothetical protein [Herpetosiphon llansteffanensis]|uniref:hypothetical protein n=1 Tax=Herpetosiphon llansteffanensis TaxID=2094568 RepID=UPI000D7CC681|nr:hypothetical protein [Herpetosiphon llansteffanensis]
MAYEQSFLGYWWLSSVIMLLLLPIGQANQPQPTMRWWFYPCMPQLNDAPQSSPEAPLSLPLNPSADHMYNPLSWHLPSELPNLSPLKQRWRYWETPLLRYAMWFHPQYVPPPKTL